MKKLKINPLVIEDLNAMKKFIGEDNERKWNELLKGFKSCFENLRVFSDMGSLVSKRMEIQSDYRYLPYKGYIIIYRSDEENVYVFRVISTYQDMYSLIFNE